jgi:predicted Ser/Thr protein kinase
MEFFARGKRGDVYLTRYRGKTVVVKQKRHESTAFGTLENEAFWLKRLNIKGIGPTFISFTDGKLRMEYIQGEPLQEYVKKKKLSKTLVKEILLQCRILDELHVNKYEMHRPVKHILFCKGKTLRKRVVMIDFERCRSTPQPKNVTQFCQYLLKIGWSASRTTLLPLLQQYKQEQSSRCFDVLLHALF